VAKNILEIYIPLLYMPTSLANTGGPLRQSIWRERQLDILFRTGRPIFNIDHNTMHIRSRNNPRFFPDPLIISPPVINRIWHLERQQKK
jgi:hypothetical protein